MEIMIWTKRFFNWRKLSKNRTIWSANLTMKIRAIKNWKKYTKSSNISLTDLVLITKSCNIKYNKWMKAKLANHMVERPKNWRTVALALSNMNSWPWKTRNSSFSLEIWSISIKSYIKKLKKCKKKEHVKEHYSLNSKKGLSQVWIHFQLQVHSMQVKMAKIKMKMYINLISQNRCRTKSPLTTDSITNPKEERTNTTKDNPAAIQKYTHPKWLMQVRAQRDKHVTTQVWHRSNQVLRRTGEGLTKATFCQLTSRISNFKNKSNNLWLKNLNKSKNLSLQKCSGPHQSWSVINFGKRFIVIRCVKKNWPLKNLNRLLNYLY